jgi:Rod binding domain-containing protein
MNIGDLLSSEPVMGMDVESLSKRAHQVGQVEIDFEEEKKKKVARDFESIFIHQILDKMKDTIPKSDLEDSSSEQIKSMYWSFMAQAVADKGGFGLWEKIYEDMPKNIGEQINQQNLDVSA